MTDLAGRVTLFDGLSRENGCNRSLTIGMPGAVPAAAGASAWRVGAYSRHSRTAPRSCYRFPERRPLLRTRKAEQ